MQTSGANDPQQSAVASEGAPRCCASPGDVKTVHSSRRLPRQPQSPLRAAVNHGDGGAFLPMAIERAGGKMALHESEQP
jgi:hypothetical protein